MMTLTKWIRQPCGHIVIIDAIVGIVDGCPVCRELEMRDEHDRKAPWPERLRRWQGRERS
jgi:hypothetical protein